MKLDTRGTERLDIMVHASNQPESSPIELEKVEMPAEGVAVMDHDDYNGPEITVTVAELKSSRFLQAIEEEGYEEVPQGVNEDPLCPQCMVQMDWRGSFASLARCPECRHEYKVEKEVRTAVSKVENQSKNDVDRDEPLHEMKPSEDMGKEAGEVEN